MQVIPVKELRERHLGVLQGLTKTEAAQQQPAAFANLGGRPDCRIQASSALHTKHIQICSDSHHSKSIVVQYAPTVTHEAR